MQYILKQNIGMNPNNKIVVLFIVFLFIRLVVYSKPFENDSTISISGQIVNSKSLRPIPMAHILIKGKRTGSICDSLGVFHLQVKQFDILKISAIGYQTKECTVPLIYYKDNPKFFQILMEEYVYLLEEVGVHALGTWNDFKYNFVKLKLEKEFFANSLISGELAQFNTRPHNIVPPQYRPKFERFSVLRVIKNPADFLFCKLNKKEKSKSKVTKMIREGGQMNKLYSTKIVEEITGLKDEQLLNFMIFFNTKLVFNEASTEYDVRKLVLEKYQVYIESK